MITINKDSNIPLFGLDFIGILDRGTNLLEIKPITACNLHCKYCFVDAGDYTNNFMIDRGYLLEWAKFAAEFKGINDIEYHIAPYGEFFLYPEYLELIKGIKALPQVKVISIQTNGMLITEDMVHQLEQAGVTRLNISFNTLDEAQAQYLSGNPKYSIQHMLDLFDWVLQSKMDLLIAPIWFFGKNDEQIPKLIELVKSYEAKGYTQDKVRLGIQNYLVYRSGRKLSKITERDFSYFYQRLTGFEKTYNIKLKLGPRDFNIHSARPITPPIGTALGENVECEIISPGRTNTEYIGRLNEEWAIKVLTKPSHQTSQPLKIGMQVTSKVIKKKTNENLLTTMM
jgi:uncharacterized Fe-S cluster-containing radical SAM superfamily enzyme